MQAETLQALRPQIDGGGRLRAQLMPACLAKADGHLSPGDAGVRVQPDLQCDGLSLDEPVAWDSVGADGSHLVDPARARNSAVELSVGLSDRRPRQPTVVRAQDALRCPLFDDPSMFEQDRALAQLLDRAGVMRDEDDRSAVPFEVPDLSEAFLL